MHHSYIFLISAESLVSVLICLFFENTTRKLQIKNINSYENNLCLVKNENITKISMSLSINVLKHLVQTTYCESDREIRTVDFGFLRKFFRSFSCTFSGYAIHFPSGCFHCQLGTLSQLSLSEDASGLGSSDSLLVSLRVLKSVLASSVVDNNVLENGSFDFDCPSR